MKLLVLDGPNLNLLGKREPGVYGSGTLEQLRDGVRKEAARLKVDVDFLQSNSEGELVTAVQDAAAPYDGLIINPGGLTHYSVALLDALLAVDIPCIEVHLTNLACREEFRRQSVVASGVIGRIEGFGAAGYRLALAGLAEIVANRK